MSTEIVELQVQVRELKERLTAHELQDERRHESVDERLRAMAEDLNEVKTALIQHVGGIRDIAFRLATVERRLMALGSLGTLIVVVFEIIWGGR